MTEAPVLVDRQGAVTVVRLNRPEVRNALDLATCTDLTRALEEAEADETVRAVVLTGTGDRAFCAGMDLRAFQDGGPSSTPLTGFLRRSYGKPLVAAVNGPAVAGGFELVLACDLVVAAQSAWFSLPEVSRGLFPAGGGTLLPRRVPLALALEVALTGERLPVERAYAAGLVNLIVPPDSVLDEAVALAQRIARHEPTVVGATRDLMHAAADGQPQDAHWRSVDQAKKAIFASEAARAGTAAFLAGSRQV
jgi:enoyl-CoA hydratase